MEPGSEGYEVGVRVPNVGRVLGEDYPIAVSQVLVPKVKEMAPKRGNGDGFPWIVQEKRNQAGMTTEIVWSNGSRMQFLVYAQEVKQHEGQAVDWLHFDEPPPRAHYMANRRGLVDRGGRLWVTMTPVDDAWMFEELWERSFQEPERIWVTVMETWDNLVEHGGGLSRRQVEEFERDLTPEERESRLRGNYRQLSGRVFKLFRRTEPWVMESPVDVGRWRERTEGWPRVMAIDPHPQKPVSCLWWVVDPMGRKVAYDELEDASLVTVADVAEAIHAKEREWGVVCDRLIDTSAHARERSSGGTLADAFREYGVETRGVAKGDKAHRFSLLHQMFRPDPMTGVPELIVMDRCGGFIRELLYLTWERSKMGSGLPSPGRLRRGKDDLVDCAMYLAASEPTFDMARAPVERERVMSVESEWAQGRGLWGGY
jgi:phage terminase large subunit-like protein